MSNIYQTQPAQNIQERKQPRRINSLQTQLAAHQNLLNFHNNFYQKTYTDSVRLLGNSQKSYILKKVQGFVKNAENIARKKVKTQQKSQINMLSYPSIQSNYSSLQNSHLLENLQQKIGQAYIKNEAEKLERIISKHNYDSEKYQTLSQRIKVRLIPPKKKIPSEECKIRSMQKYTWYRKWSKNQNNEKSRRKLKLLEKVKNVSENNRSYIKGKYVSFKNNNSLFV